MSATGGGEHASATGGSGHVSAKVKSLTPPKVSQVFFFADTNQGLACAAARRPFLSHCPLREAYKNDSAPSLGSFELGQPHG